jgi:hypothetical protein
MLFVRLIITFLLLSYAGLSFSQSQNDYILLADSSYVRGDVRIKKYQIRLSDDFSPNEPQFYNLEQVLSFRDQDDLYEVVKNFAVTYDISRKKSEDYHIETGYARIKIQGTVNLYEFGFHIENQLGKWRIAGNSGFFAGDGAHTFRMAPGGNRTMAMIPSGTLTGNGPFLVTQYLLKRTGSNEVIAIPSAVHPEKFVEFMSAYFAEYEALSYSIRKGDYTYEHIEDILNKYNLWVEQHPDATKLMGHKESKSNGF